MSILEKTMPGLIYRLITRSHKRLKKMEKRLKNIEKIVKRIEREQEEE